MIHIRTFGSAFSLMALIQITGGCDGREGQVTMPAGEAALLPSPGLAADEAGVSGVPYGVAELLRGTAFQWGPAPFTSSNNYTDPTTIVSQIALARSRGHKLILNMTGGGHARYKTDGKFDMAKWLVVMNTYDTPAIKAAVSAGVADGTVIMNIVMDEPSVTD